MWGLKKRYMHLFMGTKAEIISALCQIMGDC